MNKTRAKKILYETLGNYSDKGSELLFSCPACGHHKRKFSVNLDKNVFKCWICDYVGKDIGRLIYSYGNSDTKSQWRTLTGVVDFSEVDEVEDEKEVEETVIESTETNQEEIVEVDDIEVEEDFDDDPVPFAIIEDVPIYPGCEGVAKEDRRKCFQKK